MANPNLSQPDPELNDIWKGVTSDHFQAEMVLTIYTHIDRDAKKINDALFGKFFWAVELMCEGNIPIAMRRLYEKEKSYKLRSIPAMLNWLYDHADTVTIHNLELLKRYLTDPDKSPTEMSPADMTRAFVLKVQDHMPVENKPEANDLSAAWHIVKTARNKRIAHNEIHDAEPMDISFEHVSRLLSFAAEFIKLVGHVYMNTTLISESDRPTRSMRRLLRNAGIELSFDPTVD